MQRGRSISIDWFDREVVRFVLLWLPYGGPPDDEVFPNFGLHPGQLKRRFNRIVMFLLLREADLAEDEAALLDATRRAMYPPQWKDGHPIGVTIAHHKEEGAYRWRLTER